MPLPQSPDIQPPPPPSISTMSQQQNTTIASSPQLLGFAEYLRDLLQGRPNLSNPTELLTWIQQGHPKVLAQLLVTAPVNDNAISIACSHLIQLCFPLTALSGNGERCNNMLRILLAIVEALKMTKRYTTLYTIALETTDMCLNILESKTPGALRARSLAIQLLQTQLLGYQSDASLLTSHALRLSHLMLLALPTSTTRNDPTNQNIAKMIQCCLFLHQNVLTSRQR